MKEVTLYGGSIDSCLKGLREMAAADGNSEVLKAVFNNKYLLSTDTDDDAYLRITGKTKAEYDEEVRKWREDYEAKRKAHEARIPELTEHYREVARGVVIESELEYWDKIVPIRLGDIYHGMELQQVLDCCKVMRDESLVYSARLEKACVKLKKLMYDNLMFQGRLHREEVIDNFVKDFKNYMKGE